MIKRQKKAHERFTKDYKRSKTDCMNTLLMRVMHRTNNGKAFTIFMINNWMYDRNQNAILDDVFEALMREIDPDGLARDKKKIEEANLSLA